MTELEKKAEEWANKRCPEQGPEFIVWCMCRDDYLAGAKENAQGWIHINDKWPEPDEMILVYIPSAAEWQRIRTTIRLPPERGDNGLFPKFSSVPLKAVTHWMPLPEGPKDNDGMD